MPRLVTDANAACERYVYVKHDGTARELSPQEAEYLATDFDFGDGAMPYVKDSYKSRDGGGRIGGFIAREKLPPSVTVQPCPPDCVGWGEHLTSIHNIRRLPDF